MTEKTPSDMIHNGWKAFSDKLAPWTDDIVFWGFRKEGSKTFNVLYGVHGTVGWTYPDGSPLPADAVDFVVPASAFPPPSPYTEVFRNPLPVVVMLVMSNKGLIVIRRALVDGYGKIAMPGGFQNLGETWQAAGCREFVEETGVQIDAEKVKIYDVITVRNGSVNLIFGIYDGIVIDPEFKPDSEIMEVLEIGAPVDTAFPAHTEIMARYFAEYGGLDRDQIVVAG
nr:NUDIX domain-containing protein [Neorhizobium tomejilense]